eukprot:7379755-Ditylum_brightwellii.AAC.1
MGTAKFTIIRTVIHNNLVGGIFDKGQGKIQPLQWKLEPNYLRFTSLRDKATGWSQEGLNFFVEHCKADEVARA